MLFRSADAATAVLDVDKFPPAVGQGAIGIEIREDDDKNKEYFELYISIKGLQDRLSPDFDLSANRWLFNYFTSSLDQSLLRSLNHGLEFMGSESIGININLSTALSADFQKFDERLPAAYRGKVILEIGA